MSSSVTKSRLLAKNDNQTFLSTVLEMVETDKIDVLLPIGALSVSRLNSHRELFENRVGFALAPKKSLDLALNKSRTLRHASSIGVNCPVTLSFGSIAEISGALRGVRLPFVMKSASELYKYGPIYVHSESQISELLAQSDLEEACTKAGVIVQEQISGPGVGFFALYQDGSCKRMFMHERLRETPSTGGSSWAARGIYNEELASSGLTLLDSLNWHGPAMVEYKLDANTGKPVLMELNPKFWGSLDLAIQSGVDFPTNTVKVAQGKELEADFNFEVGKSFVWPLESLKEYAFDSSLHVAGFDSNIRISDPLPSIYQLFQKVALYVLGDSVLKLLLYWMMKHNFRDFMSRLSGQIFGLPFQVHCAIDSQLWIGAKPGLVGRLILRLKGFTVRFSLIEEKGVGGRPKKLRYFWRPLKEFKSIPTSSLWDYTDELLDLHNQGNRIFIHCREGVGRAPALGIALLIRLGAALEDAIELVQAGRTVTSLNEAQLESLRVFYRDFKRSSS